jgi:zinc protease
MFAALARRAAGTVALIVALMPAARAATPEIPFEQYRLQNGLDVILHVDHAAPLAHVEVWYKVGSKDEVPGKTGFAHLFEHMMFQGTKHIPEDAYFKYLGQAGASARNGSTSTDRTNYFETLPSSELELGLWLESSRMGFLLERPSFRAAFENQRDVVKNERRQRVENVPLGLVGQIEAETLYPAGHPYSHEVIGSMADLDAATENDVRSFFSRYYAPNNAVLLIAGDIDPARVKGLVEKYFGTIPAGPPVVRRTVPPVPTPTAERRLAMEAKVNLPQGIMAWTTVPFYAPGDAELDLASSILAGGKSSRLYRRLVYDLKVAQSVSAAHHSRVYGGIFEIRFAPMPGHTVAELEKLINEELDRLRTAPVELAELERVRNEVKTDAVSGLQSLQGVGSRLLAYNVFAGDAGYFSRDLARYEQADPAALQTWASKVLRPESRLTITIDPNPAAPIMGRLKTPVPTASKRPVAAADDLPTRKAPDADFRSHLPASGPKTDFKVPAVKRFRLKNGLQVVLAESHKLPLFAAQLVVRTGGAANPKGKAGLADLTASMLTEGTAKRSANQIADEIAQLGATLEAGTAWDDSWVAVSGLTEHLDRALDVWADVITHPAFADDEVTRVRDNLLSTLARRKDYPPVVAGQAFSRVVYGESHPYGWSAFGTEKTVKDLAPRDLKDFYGRYYVPGNAVLVVAGDISESALREKAEKLLGGWKGKAVVAPLLPKPTRPDKLRLYLVDKAGAPQSSIRVGLVGLDRKNPDYHRALVMNAILGGSFKRLVMNLREAKGWTYGVSSSFDARRTPGPWTVAGEFVAAHTADSVTEILKEIDKLRSEDVTDRELQDIKDEIVKAFPARFATANQVANQMAGLAIYGLPDNELQTFCAKINTVTKADVRKMAQKYLLPNFIAVVVVGDRTSIEGSLRKIADVEVRDIEGEAIAAK